MVKHTFFATATICGIIALTGCSAKQSMKHDVASPSTVLTTATPAPSLVVTQATVVDTMNNLVIDEESLPQASEKGGLLGESLAESRLDTVYFDFDAYLLGAEARDTLTRNAALLDESKLTRVIIEGHADERGSDDYNMALAEKRAFAVRRYIETLGVNLDRMEIVSYGEDKPAIIGHDEAAWAKNRRVEFDIVK